MKKLCFLLLMSWVVMDVTAQNVVSLLSES